MTGLLIASNFALIVLAFITWYLSRQRNVHFFIVVGQEVFKWLFAVLVVIIITRILLSAHIMSTPMSRNINSSVFFLSVIGILWSVYRHGRAK